MITVRLQGGLGNQMFQYAMALFLASGQRDQIKLDTSILESRFRFCKYTFRRFELSVFGIPEIFTFSSYIVRKSRFFREFIPPQFWDIFNRLFAGRSYVREFNGIKVLNFPSDCFLHGYWQDPSYFDSLESLLREIFTVRGKPSSENARVLEDISASGTASISLHVRRGDYVTLASANSWHGICGLEYYKAAVAHVSSRIAHPRYFVFSDDITWARDNLILPPNTVFVGHNTKKGEEDLRLMYSCSHHIIANSSFSWWGAWL